MELLDDAALMSHIVTETNKDRMSFLEMLEEKYVKNQDDSDIIDMRTLKVVEDNGHLRKHVRKKFGYLSSYYCKAAKKPMEILKRRVRIKRHLKVYRCDDEDGNTTQDLYLNDIKSCAVKLVQLDLDEGASRREDELRKRKTVAMGGKASKKVLIRNLNKNTTIDDLISRRVKFAEIEDITSVKMSGEIHEYMRRRNVSICDLSFRSCRFDEDPAKSKMSMSLPNRAVKKHQRYFKQTNVRKSRNVCVKLEQEVEIEDEYHSGDMLEIWTSSISKATSLRTSIPREFQLEQRKNDFADGANLNMQAIEEASAYEKNLHSKNMVVSGIKTLPVPVAPPSFNLNFMKKTSPNSHRHFLRSLKF